MIKIPPEKIFPTRFDGYYVSEDGKVWRRPHKFFDGKNAKELIEVKQFFRGGGSKNKKGGEYLGVNISIKCRDTGKTIRQEKHYIHRLIAETLIENPKNFSEVDHINRDKLCNYANNLRWVDRSTNMRNK